MNSDFRAQGKRGEIWLYDPIGNSYFGDSISAKQFSKELTALGKVDSISLRINSPGGDVFDGFAIYNQLKQHPATVVVSVDGLAASIASIIAMAGDSIKIAANAMMMIHDPQGVAVGDAGEMNRVAALLQTVKGNLADTYAARTAQSKADIEAWMADETWLTAEEAVRYGFADATTSEVAMSATFDLGAFRNLPAALRKRLANSNPRPASDRYGVRITEAGRRLAAICKP